MADIVFLALAAITIIAAILSLEARELVYGAIGLAVTFVGVAGIFILLESPYLAIFQIAVYVGAVVVLILFTVMLVRRDAEESTTREERRDPWTRLGLWVGSLIALGVAGAATLAASIPLAPKPTTESSLTEISIMLSERYGVPLVILALIITSALVGTLTLAKRDHEGQSES